MGFARVKSEEVRFLMENISAGVHCLTTVHLDDVSKLPDRFKKQDEPTKMMCILLLTLEYRYGLL